MKQYVIRLLYDVKGWAYYNRCVALKKYAPPDFQVSIGPDYGKALGEKKQDLVLQLAFSYCEPLKKTMTRLKICRDTVLLASYNVGWGHANRWLDGTMQFADHTIINNYEMWEKAGKRPKTTPLSNGVDNETFKETTEIRLRENKVLWCGSEHHRKVKGFDDFIIPLTEMLKKDNIILDHRLTNSSKPGMNSEQMNQWYNTGSVYLVTSKCEGTPNPALEAAAAGCVLVSTRVGNMPELINDGLNGYLCDRDLNALYTGIKNAIANKEKLSAQMSIDIKDWYWENRAKKFYELFRKLIDERRRK